MYILQKNCPQTSFPGGKEAPNILHGGKMLAPHFKDEIASLQKWPFLAGFWPFLEQFFFIMTHIYRQTKYILQKNCPQMSFPGCRKAPKILLPLLKGSHRLLNWQIQITRVSWVGQSTNPWYEGTKMFASSLNIGNFGQKMAFSAKYSPFWPIWFHARQKTIQTWSLGGFLKCR